MPRFRKPRNSKKGLYSKCQCGHPRYGHLEDGSCKLMVKLTPRAPMAQWVPCECEGFVSEDRM